MKSPQGVYKRSHMTRLALALLSTATLFACRSVDPRITPPYAETPAVYTENRVFYVAPPETSDDVQVERARRRLYQPFELPLMPTVMRSTESAELPASVDATPSANDKWAVQHGDPLSIIVHGVRIPDDMSAQFGNQSTFDVAVIVDIMSGTTQSEANSLVVWYQTGVPAGQMLNFRDLLVYYDPAWDSAFAPYFRIRVLDVRALSSDTTLTRTLRSIGTLASSFAGVIPTPVMPGVAIAMDAASQVLERPQKRVLMDFAVQFYSEEQRRQAGGDLGQLRRGSWVVVGRPEESFAKSNALRAGPVTATESGGSPERTWQPVASDFWRRPLFVDQQTGQMHDAKGSLMEVPYVLVTISTAHSQVPSIVARRSEELIRLLSSAEGRASTTDLETQSQQLTSSVVTYVAERRLMRNRTVDDVGNLMGLLDSHLAAKKSGLSTGLLSNESERQLLLVVNRLFPGGNRFATATAASEWWGTARQARGGLTNLQIQQAADAPLGFYVKESK
jgi:hypothetical protein